MKGVLSRAKSAPRGGGGGGGGESGAKEKEPFYVGPYRSKSASPARKPRSNSENVPPDNNVHVSPRYDVPRSRILFLFLPLQGWWRSFMGTPASG
jgi:hypothetical protein